MDYNEHSSADRRMCPLWLGWLQDSLTVRLFKKNLRMTEEMYFAPSINTLWNAWKCTSWSSSRTGWCRRTEWWGWKWQPQSVFRQASYWYLWWATGSQTLIFKLGIRKCLLLWHKVILIHDTYITTLDCRTHFLFIFQTTTILRHKWNVNPGWIDGLVTQAAKE